MTDELSTSTAVAEHEAGRLDKAESIYRARLSQHPEDLATIIGLADVLTDAGQFADAEELYRRAIALDGESPAAAGAYDGLAAIRQDLGDLENAIPASKMAAQLRGSADDSFGVGNTLEYLGRNVDAIDMFVLATEQRAGFSQAHIKAAQHLLAVERCSEAIPHYLAAIDAHPEMAELHCNLANAYRRVGKLNEALDSCRRAIELKPKLAESHVIMGAIWKDRRRPSDALESLRRALAINPNLADPTNIMAVLVEQAGQIEQAASLYARAVELQPDSAQFHENLGISLLLRGQFARGWQEYDWRRLKPSNPGSRPFPQPAWDGSPLDGKTIMLFAEQGFGDTIQFLRYAKIVADRGARVLLECQAPLVSVARQVSGIAEVIPQGEIWPECDAQLALMSVPMVLGTDLHSIPNKVPYISADPQLTAAWRDSLKGLSGKRIGVAWEGSATHKNDKNRSMSARRLAPLAEVPGISLISLQKLGRSAPPENLKMLDRTVELMDFSDTAALIANLDLVVTVDTAVAHLAGAMGKPVWVLLPSVPDWRWLLGRDDSPWYPTARLFRQEIPGDWAGVMRRVCEELGRSN
jgi:tetratricopeptide (TPR) repeat protein